MTVSRKGHTQSYKIFYIPTDQTLIDDTIDNRYKHLKKIVQPKTVENFIQDKFIKYIQIENENYKISRNMDDEIEYSWIKNTCALQKSDYLALHYLQPVTLKSLSNNHNIQATLSWTIRWQFLDKKEYFWGLNWLPSLSYETRFFSASTPGYAEKWLYSLEDIQLSY